MKQKYIIELPERCKGKDNLYVFVPQKAFGIIAPEVLAEWNK
jgi:hypothetical protein